MELTPATLAQVRQGSRGEFVQIDADVGNVVADLQAIDANLRVRYSEAGEYFVVYYREEYPDASFSEYVVLTATELDQRIVKRVEEIGHAAYDYAAELEKADAEAQKRADAILHEHVGQVGERLFHAMRKDLGAT